MLSVINSDKDVMFSSAFVCSFGSRIMQKLLKTTAPIFTKFSRKVIHGSWKKPLDFGDNLDQITLIRAA